MALTIINSWYDNSECGTVVDYNVLSARAMHLKSIDKIFKCAL